MIEKDRLCWFSIPFIGVALEGGMSPLVIKSVWFGYISHLLGERGEGSYSFPVLILPVTVPVLRGNGETSGSDLGVL